MHDKIAGWVSVVLDWFICLLVGVLSLLAVIFGILIGIGAFLLAIFGVSLLILGIQWTFRLLMGG